VQLPQININGTERKDLLHDYMAARRALQLAVEALSACSPHGRDYQTAEPGAFYAAQREHADRLVKVRSVMAEIETLAEHVV
jgi:hypothetical protein